MKRNISVFILLILLASSFKYRTKTKESGQPFITAGFNNQPIVKAEEAPSLHTVVDQMQKANLDKANGNPEMIKALWSHSDSVTIFNGKENLELKGWNAVRAELDKAKYKTSGNYTYKVEKIASHQSGDQACILQKEYYQSADGKPVNLYATILFRKENNTWKIVHRQEDSLAPTGRSDKSSK